MKVCFYTLGCKVNQYETQVMHEIFENGGYTVTQNCEDASVIVINSCSVTAESDRKTRQLVRKCRKANDDAVIVLTGCMVQAFPENSFNLTPADIVLGNKDFSNILNYVIEFNKTKTRKLIYEKHKNNEPFNTLSISDFEERTRAYLKIEDGCDRFCSYCIIPYARGRVRSKPIFEIINEAKVLADKGFSELVLVGINLSAYGKNEDFNICDVIESIADIEKVKRIRLGSLEPDHITNEMLIRLKNIQKFCPQFHLSLQSGCDETLKRMNRKYDCAFYKDLTDRILNIFPDAAITTDIMVGFAGETDEEFNKTKEFVKNIGFARAHIFPYSRRSGTVADKFQNHVENSVKVARAKEMAEISRESERKFIEKFLGQTLDVLFETPENDYSVGYTANYIRVKVKSNCNLSGKILPVKITDIFEDYCIGII